MKPFDLQERLINFAVQIIRISRDLESSKAGNHICGQLIRSGTSPSLNYSEAQSAESKNDFVHKMSIVFKELRETLSCLKIIERAKLYLAEDGILLGTAAENNELVAIFVKSIETSKRKFN